MLTPVLSGSVPVYYLMPAIRSKRSSTNPLVWIVPTHSTVTMHMHEMMCHTSLFWNPFIATCHKSIMLHDDCQPLCPYMHKVNHLCWGRGRYSQNQLLRLSWTAGTPLLLTCRGDKSLAAFTRGCAQKGMEGSLSICSSIKLNGV